MRLTQQIADRYVGGQLEVQNPDEKYLFRGEISTITVDGDNIDATLRLTLTWMAKREGFPSLPGRWVGHDCLTYDLSLMLYSASDIGEGRIVLSSSIMSETATLFRPDGSKLDPSKIEGLNLAGTLS